MTSPVVSEKIGWETGGRGGGAGGGGRGKRRTAGGEREGAPLLACRGAFEGRRQEPPGGDGRAADIGSRHEDDELVAADPEGGGAAPGVGAEEAPHRREQGVAAGVAELVVDPLEVVEVDEDQR